MQLWSVEMAAIPCLLYYQLLFRKNVSNMVLRSQFKMFALRGRCPRNTDKGEIIFSI